MSVIPLHAPVLRWTVLRVNGGEARVVGSSKASDDGLSIDPKEAKEWFGATPPDLTVIARSRAAAGQGEQRPAGHPRW